MEDYKLGFNVYNSTLENMLDYSLENNLSHIEVNLSKSHSSVESFDQKRIKYLKQRTSELEIDISFHLPSQINIADNIARLSRKNIRYISKTIELANEMGVKYINSHLGFFFWFPVSRWQRDKALVRFVKNLEMIVQICEEKKVHLAFENVTPLPEGSEHYLLGDNLEDFKFIFEEIQSPWIKFCLDTGHANIAEGVNNYIDEFSEKLIAVHYHDNDGSDDSHKLVGEGNIDWKVFWEKLDSINFKGPFISECRGLLPHESVKKLFEFKKGQIASPVKS
jgi:sugar phosphate isomerase/epimerase